MPCQQGALYRSEETCPRGRELTLAEAQAFVDRMRDLEWFARAFPMVRYIDVEAARASGPGSVGAWQPERGAGVVQMHPAHLCERVLCHEVAHVLAAARYGQSCGHSPWFARIYLTLVSLMCGAGAYAALYGAFERDGIEHAVDEDGARPGVILAGAAS